jgi:hypothetical protein
MGSLAETVLALEERLARLERAVDIPQAEAEFCWDVHLTGSGSGYEACLIVDLRADGKPHEHVERELGGKLRQFRLAAVRTYQSCADGPFLEYHEVR